MSSIKPSKMEEDPDTTTATSDKLEFTIDNLIKQAGIDTSKHAKIKAFLEFMELDKTNIATLMKEDLDEQEKKYNEKKDKEFNLGKIRDQILQGAAYWKEDKKKRKAEYIESAEKKYKGINQWQDVKDDNEWLNYTKDPTKNWSTILVNCHDFPSIRKNKGFFRDITDVVPILFQRSKVDAALVFLRPPRFGKTMLLDILLYYHDVAEVSDFLYHFKGTKAENCGVPNNEDLVMRFNFATVSNFSAYLEGVLNGFCRKYSDIFDIDGIKTKDPFVYMGNVFTRVLETEFKVIILIDEHDAILNNALFSKSADIELIKKDLKVFFSIIKEYIGASVKKAIRMCLLVGILPMALGEISRDFNILKNLTFEEEFASVLGFSDDEIRSAISIVCSKASKSKHEEQTEHKHEEQTKSNHEEQLFRTIKFRFNGYRFTPGATGLYCTNMALEALRALVEGVPIPTYSANNDVNSQILTFINEMDSGHQIITLAVSNNSIKFSKKKDQWKFIDLLSAANFELQEQLVCTILLNVGALAYSAKQPEKTEDPELVVTNGHVRACLARFRYSKDTATGIGDKLQDFFLRNSVEGLASYLENSAPYLSTKPEAFIRHTEEVLQSMFAALLYVEGSENIAVEKRTASKWIDVVGWFGNCVQVVEFKNIQLDYINVPVPLNQKSWNVAKLCESHQNFDLITAKAKALKDLDKNGLLNLKIASFAQFNPNKTVQELIDEAFVQAWVYALELHQTNEFHDKFLYVHIIVGIGKTRILTKTLPCKVFTVNKAEAILQNLNDALTKAKTLNENNLPFKLSN